MVEPGHIHFSSFEQMFLSGAATTRLLTACALGGLVGMEREWRHKDSGLRTNMLICMGSALFTMMSVVLAGDDCDGAGIGRAASSWSGGERSGVEAVPDGV
jgi:putative Mg2+ transporter-C (MgtC) family protein